MALRLRKCLAVYVQLSSIFLPDVDRSRMQEIVTIERNVSSDDVLNDLRRDFPKHPVSLVRFGWIAVDVGVDVTVRLKVRSKRVTVYARRRVAPSVLGALFGGSLLSNYAELELTRELNHAQKRFSDWITSKYSRSGCA
jgi:hypothetical protein